MRGLRSFLALVVIAVGLGAYIYFVESKRTPGETETREKVFSIESAEIMSLEVRAESGDDTKLHKKDEAWEIVEPVQSAADGSIVTGITTNLASLEIQRVVAEQPEDDDEYGLASPRLELAFTAGGDAEHRLLVGSKTPTGGDMYAKVAGQNRVFLIPAYLDGTFNRTTFDLRDKAVLKFVRSDVDRLEITSGGETVRLVKSGADWKLDRPLTARAEYGTVESAIGRVENARMSAIVADSGDDLKAFGLETPTMTVQVGAGSAAATLAIGMAAEGDKVYARDLSRPIVFTIDKTVVDELEKPASDFRRKDQFEFRPFNATRIEFLRDGKTRVFEKTTSDDVDTWRQTAPEPAEPDSTKVESLLSSFANLRAESFVESTRGTGLDEPILVVTVTFGTAEDQKTERVAFGQADDEAFAAPEGEPGAAKLDQTAFTNALKALDEVG